MSPPEATPLAMTPAFVLVGAGHPIPRDPIISPVRGSRALVRAVRWMARDRNDGLARGTVLICNGRGEFVEKYFDVVEELLGRGFAVVAFDWSGQGLSMRALRNPRKSHVADFDHYGQDLASVVAQVLDPFCPKPWFALAHSMGGAVALGFAADNPDLFDRLVLSAPMIGIARLPFADMTRLAARLCRFGGLSRSYVPVRRAGESLLGGFAGNLLTSDEARYDKALDYVRAEPRLAVGRPTFGWLHAAFVAMARLHGDAFSLRFKTPTLVVNPGADLVVDPRATERLMSRLRATRVVSVPRSRHEILMERDVFRDQFWAAFDAFVPGRG